MKKALLALVLSLLCAGSAQAQSLSRNSVQDLSGITATDTTVTISGSPVIAPGWLMVIDREAVQITAVSGTSISINRAVGGILSAHANSSTILFGPPSSFQTTDVQSPDCSPTNSPIPYLNVRNTRMWVCNNIGSWVEITMGVQSGLSNLSNFGNMSSWQSVGSQFTGTGTGASYCVGGGRSCFASTADARIILENNAFTKGAEVNVATPTLGTCTAGALTSGSLNFAGQYTGNTSGSCVVNFGTPNFTNTPFCFAMSTASTTHPRISASSASSITITGGVSGETIQYFCVGRIGS